ncbi:MAG: hypothetical protein IKV94_03625 [Clostridia bacterium]|nr:hypothetical protein [Clostridia bacterium]
MNDFMKRVKYLSRKHKVIAIAIVFVTIYLLSCFIVNSIVEPSETELSNICEKHLRISREFSNIERYEGASFELVHNSISNTDDTIVTIQEKTYKVVARYTSENELLSFDLVYTVPFYPYIKYYGSVLCSIILGIVLICILKKKDFFKELD